MGGNSKTPKEEEKRKRKEEGTMTVPFPGAPFIYEGFEESQRGSGFSNQARAIGPKSKLLRRGRQSERKKGEVSCLRTLRPAVPWFSSSNHSWKNF